MPRYQRVPPRRPVPWALTLRLWAAIAAALLALLLLVAWGERVPEPVPASAPATVFSAARAWPVLAELSDTLGHRLPGTAASAAAREYLVRRLRAIPGLQVQVQDTVATRRTSRGMVAFRVQNVIARLPGLDPDAVLVSAHYDSPAESVGAADDAVAVAAIVEAARALAAGPRPHYTVIFNINDGEEQGLLGAQAFLLHPWARDVRAFLNLESAGNVGKAILFQAGPGNAWLTGRYARSVPYPYGSVIGQDIFQSGAIPSGTDFEVYRTAGLRGLDVAFYRGGWAYHTALDQVSAVAPGSLQHMGANALALVRDLAAGPLPGDTGGSPSVYYDVLGLMMVRYGHPAAIALAVAAALLLLLAVRSLLRHRLVLPRTLRPAMAIAVLGLVLAIVLPVGTAALIAGLLGRGFGWFAHPWRAVVGYGAVALLPLLLLQWRFAHRTAARDETNGERLLASFTSAYLVLLVLLILFTVTGIGSGFLFFWWTLGGAAGVAILARTEGEAWPLAAVVALLPGALVTLQTGYLAIELFAPIGGRLVPPFPFELVMAGIVGLLVAIVAPPAVALLHRDGRLGAASAIVGATAVVGLLLLAFSFPFTPTRPQRLAVVHEGGAAAPRLTLRSWDELGPVRAATAADASDRPLGAGAGADGALWYPAPQPPLPPPSLELLGESRTATGDRVLELQLVPNGAYETTVALPSARPATWRIAGTSDQPEGTAARVRFIAAPDSGWRMTVTVPGTGALPIVVQGRHAGATPAAQALLSRLPRWSTAFATARVETRVQL